MKRQGIARKAIAAGLGIAMALGSVAPAVALADSDGNTNLYIESQTDNITTPEGAPDENIKVVLPVAINYVADTEGNLTGPSDNTVKIKNNTQLGSVHVSRIQVTPETGVTLARSVAEVDSNDEVYLNMAPGSGSSISLASYREGAAPSAGEWDIAQQGELALNGLTGKIGGFSNIDPSTKEKVATIHWTVASGTAEQAAVNAGRFVIHLVSPDNSINDLVTNSTGSTGTLPSGYIWRTSNGLVITSVSTAVSTAGNGATEATLYGTPNS